MKWNNKGHQFDGVFEQISKNQRSYVMWGYGSFGRKFYQRIKGKISIDQIFDVNESGCTIDEYTIQNPDSLVLDKKQVIIVTAISAYEEISNKLIEYGYVENEDFMNGRTFMEVFFAYHYDQLFLNGFDISITERCTLSCRKCNMFMAYFKEPKDRDVQNLKKDMDVFFSHVEHVEILNILGGEPFLHSGLLEFMKYLAENYDQKISSVGILSNGMVTPKKEEIDFLQEHPKFFLKLSDYTKTIPYKGKLEENLQLFQQRGIVYEMVHYDSWMDFGFPEKSMHLEKEAALEHFENCMPPFRGLYNEKYYFCHVQTSTIRAGLCQENENDYLDLNREISKKEFLEFDRGYSEQGYITLCENCRGCGSDNTLLVEVAEQKER